MTEVMDTMIEGKQNKEIFNCLNFNSCKNGNDILS